METIILDLAKSSPVTAAILVAATLIAKVLIKAREPINQLTKQIESITESLTEITTGLSDMKKSISDLNGTMTRLVVEREHDRRDIEILRDDLKSITSRIDSTQSICRRHHGEG